MLSTRIFKFIKRVVITIFIIFVSTGNIGEMKANELRYNSNYTIEIQDNLSVFIVETGETHIFQSIADRDLFISLFKTTHDQFSSRSFKCYPGLPGYPLCQTDPIVNVSTKNTGRTLFSPWRRVQYLNANWWRGPINLKPDRLPFSITISFTYLGITGKVTFSPTTSGNGYYVPKNRSGRIAMYARIKLIDNTITVTHKSGKKTVIKSKTLKPYQSELRLDLR